jgi:hypothetical protein
MRIGNKYDSHLKKQVFLFFASLVLFVTYLFARADCMIVNNPVNGFKDCHTTLHSGHLSLLHRACSGRGLCSCDINSVPESLQKNSSQPLSSQNYSKTRPRGIAVQEAEFKNPVLTCVLFLYPPDPARIIFPGWVPLLSSTGGVKEKIRPPPLTSLVGTRSFS